DLGGMAGAGTPDHALYVGGMILRGTNGNIGFIVQNWGNAIRGHESWDTSRRNHILYETPTLAGFNIQAAYAEDNYWDIALRYAGEHHGFRLAFGIGYQEDSEFNGGAQAGENGTGIFCTTRCDAKTKELKGSASILHVATGLFLTGSAGTRELDATIPNAYLGPDAEYWHLAWGVRRNFFGFGDTVLFGEYGEHSGGLAQASFFTANVNAVSDNTVTNWGRGINQYIDAAAMEVFLTYKNYSIDQGPEFIPLSDLQVLIGGARVNF
ncbi:MAG: hypothetical protein ACKVP3_01150, partial [Hyphomicrobiaceae bacterium]